jgi:hypothetical protein
MFFTKSAFIVSKVFVLLMRLTILLNRINYLSIHCMFPPKALLTLSICFGYIETGWQTINCCGESEVKGDKS